MTTITVPRELIEQAREALVHAVMDLPWPDETKVINALTAALAQQAEQTPDRETWVNNSAGWQPTAAAPTPQAGEAVAWLRQDWSGTGVKHLSFEGPPDRKPVRDEVVNPVWTPLYTHPAPTPTEQADARDAALNTLAAMFHSGEEMEGDDGMVMVVDLALWHDGVEALDVLIGDEDDAAMGEPT